MAPGPFRFTIFVAMARTVLIVDDHPSFRASARMLLESEGFEVIGEAENGLGAIDAVHELAPDLVLLDVQLPDIDGIEVAARLTRNGSAPDRLEKFSSGKFSHRYVILSDSVWRTYKQEAFV